MTSIARKINISFWLKEVGNVIGINIIIAFLIMGTWMYWCTTKLPDQVTGEHYYFNVNQEKHTLEYVIDGNDRKSYAYDFRDVRDLVAVPGIILLSAEGFVLFFALFRTSVVRRKLKPLNDLAVKAEQISKMSFEQNGMEDQKKRSDRSDHSGPVHKNSSRFDAHSLLYSIAEILLCEKYKPQILCPYFIQKIK